MSDLLSDLGNVLDTPSAILRAGLAGRNPFTGIFDPEHRVSGRDVLESWGVLGKNRPGFDAGDLAGGAAEMLLDPMNLLGLGIGTKLLKSMAKVKAANAVSKKLRAMGAMPEEVAKLTKIVDESGKPLRTYHGTPHAYDKVDAAKLNNESLKGPGYYTTDSGPIASEYVTKGSSKLRRTLLPDSERARIEELRQLSHKLADRSEARSAKAAALENAQAPNAKLLKSVMEGDAERTGRLADKASAHVLRRTLRAPEPPYNVRMQYIDARKPFDERALYPLAEMEKLTGPINVKPPSQGRITETVHKVLAGAIDHDMGAARLNPAVWPETADKLRNVALGLENPEDAIKAINEIVSTTPTHFAGKFLFDDMNPIHANARLRHHGYDSIIHTGGQNIGDVHHKVVVAFDPSQIYSPYIAPALQRERRLMPTLSPLAAALFGHNALARNHGAYGRQEIENAY